MIYTSRRGIEFFVIHPVLQQSELEASLTTPVAIPLFKFEVALPLLNNIMGGSLVRNGTCFTFKSYWVQQAKHAQQVGRAASCVAQAFLAGGAV